MIKTRKNVTPGKTPEKITVTMIDQDLKNGISKPEMAIKYGIKPWEVDEMFKHELLKGRRPSRKKSLSFSFVDDTIAEENRALLNTEPEVDPNQVTLEDAIEDAKEGIEQAVNGLKNTNEAIVDILGPHTQTPEEIIKEAAEWKAEDSETGKEIKLDQGDQNMLYEALDTMVNENGETLRETFDKELEKEEKEEELEIDDNTFEL